MQREGCLNAPNPVKGCLLPKGNVPEFLKDGVRGKADAPVRLIFRYAFKDESGRSCCAIATEDPFLKTVVTKGKDVVGVAHLGRVPNAYQRSALDWLYPAGDPAERMLAARYNTNGHQITASNTCVN